MLTAATAKAASPKKGSKRKKGHYVLDEKDRLHTFRVRKGSLSWYIDGVLMNHKKKISQLTFHNGKLTGYAGRNVIFTVSNSQFVLGKLGDLISSHSLGIRVAGFPLTPTERELQRQTQNASLTKYINSTRNTFTGVLYTQRPLSDTLILSSVKVNHQKKCLTIKPVSRSDDGSEPQTLKVPLQGLTCSLLCTIESGQAYDYTPAVLRGRRLCIEVGDSGVLLGMLIPPRLKTEQQLSICKPFFGLIESLRWGLVPIAMPFGLGDKQRWMDVCGECLLFRLLAIHCWRKRVLTGSLLRCLWGFMCPCTRICKSELLRRRQRLQAVPHTEYLRRLDIYIDKCCKMEQENARRAIAARPPTQQPTPPKASTARPHPRHTLSQSFLS
eukprot:TRINITY_DN33964_c0_g1_i1.p1 TRINITY_DN33964_c0_g1~~TRINITY_DN33964_c0_g1_i1.p1  ORF type:complete len:384 (+),score=51.26 TRINITY_DN33964_c0_g1_i1:69-1220(+)